MTQGESIPLESFFAEHDPSSRELFELVRGVVDALDGDIAMRVTKSQVAWRRRTGFAWAWIPGQHLRGKDLAPLVLSVGLHHRDESPRWKEVTEVRPGRFMHHLELRAAEEIDHQVAEWLREAWEQAG